MIFSKKLIAGGLVAFSMALTGCLTEEGGEGTPLVAKGTISVGAQANPTLGTAVNLDTASAGMVMGSGAANLNKGLIDFAVIHDSVGGDDMVHLMNGTATNASNVPYGATWDSAGTYPNLGSVQFVSVTAAPADLEAATAAYTAGPRVNETAALAVNQIYVVRSSRNEYFVVTITSISAHSGTATVQISVQGR